MAQTKILTIEVHGMDCQNCANNVTKTLDSVKGVTRAEVDFQKGKATVWFENSEDQVGLQRVIRKAITKAGYLVGDIR